jgi:hypothetical protein
MVRERMALILDHPWFLFAIAVAAQWIAAYGGDLIRRRAALAEAKWADLDLIRAATLTLLGLIIGFTFQMAVTRYDQRKTYEREEANAIGTEYLRADLLATADADKLRALLPKYLQQRVLFYTVDDAASLARVDSETTNLESELWQTVSRAANANPTPPMALAVSGMNDVLNARGYTQAAWWNRIPLAAWGLMGLIAISANVILGYGERQTDSMMLLVLPVVISIAIFLIADIDSPRGGIIRVPPQNLIALSQSLGGR